jgi:TPR repeat protein
MSFDKVKARRLLKEGDVANALTYIQQHADVGSIEALIELANYYYAAGNMAKSEHFMQRAEDCLHPDDLDGRIDLASAYRLGLGGRDRQWRRRRALDHLEAVGEAGNVMVQESLMLHYLEGLNDAPVDLAKALYWAKKAHAAGSVLAKRHIKKLTRSL